MNVSRGVIETIKITNQSIKSVLLPKTYQHVVFQPVIPAFVFVRIIIVKLIGLAFLFRQ